MLAEAEKVNEVAAQGKKPRYKDLDSKKEAKYLNKWWVFEPRTKG